MKGPFLMAAAFLAVALSFAIPLRASIDRGAIRGTVADQSEAAVPGARVVVKNEATNVQLNLTTNPEGFYLAPELIPGKYSIHVLAAGFSPLNVSDILVTAGVTTTVDVQLRVGTATQTIQVTAAAPLADTSSSNFTTSLATNYVQDIPLPGHDIQALIQLIPGITQSAGPSGALFGFDSQFGGFPDPLHLVGSAISANGSQAGANAWYLDGSLNAVVGAENVAVNPSPDSVGEFNVVDNGLAAEYGRTSGAVVNIVLKSGTNNVHSDLYGFNRNSYFDATNPFGRRNAQGQPLLAPRVNSNNFGGTLGGPVYLPHLYNGKNKTFFFVSWDISMLHENEPTIQTVPLPNEALGNFTGDPRFAPVCGVNGATNCLYNPYTTTGPDAEGLFHRVAFPTPVIPQNLIDPLAKWYLSTYPTPNFVDPLQQGPTGCLNLCNNFLGTVGSSQTTHNISVKIDQNISDKDKLFVEWLFNPSYYENYRYPWDGPTAPTTAGIAGAEPYRTINQLATIGWTSTISPTLLNEVRFTFSRQNQIATPNPDSVVDNTAVLNHVQGLNFILYPPYQIVPAMNVGGFPGTGPQPWQNAIQGAQAYTFLDNVTKIMGKHTWKSGLMFRRDNGFNLAAWGYNLNFWGDLTSDPVTGLGGAPLAQFLMGAVEQGSYTGTYHAPWSTNDYYGFYTQDDWRISPSFTLNIGLRYDILGWFRERYNDLANFNFNEPNPQLPNYLGSIDYFGTPMHPARNVFPANKGDLGPRIAFAWAPFRNRKTVIRGGFGIIYSNGISTAFGDDNGAVSGPGFANLLTYSGDFTGERPAFQLSQGAPPLTIPSSDFAKQQQDQFLATTVEGFMKGDKDPYVEQWSFQIQRELPGDIGLSLGYVGTHGLHLFGDEFRNYDYVPTAVLQNLRGNINNPIPTDPAIGALYGCGSSCPASITMRPYPEYQEVEPNTVGDGFNRYNSFQAKVEKRTSHGLNFTVAYTIQKNIETANTGSTIGDPSTPTGLARNIGRLSLVPGGDSGGSAERSGISGRYQNPDDRLGDVALAPDDIPQILNMAVIYVLPFGQGKRFLSSPRGATRILGGWKLTQNWNFQSGVPLVFTGPCNDMTCRPNLIGNPSSGRSGKSKSQRENQWFDPSAFEAVFGSDPTVIQEVSTGLNPDGTPFNYNTFNPWWQFGTAGLRPPDGRAPGFWNLDATLAKDFHFSETRYLQFRWTTLNTLNHQNLGLPNTNWCLPPNPDGSTDLVHQFGCQFGKITNVQTDPRNMEFGLKFYW